MLTLLGVAVFFGVLMLKYKTQPADRPKRTTQQKLKFAKLLFAALIAWMAIGYALQNTIRGIDGVTEHEPSLMERLVAYFR